MLSVAALSANNAWAVGDGPNGISLIEHWDGNQWSIVSSPGTTPLRGVAAVAANDIWAIGGTQQTLTEHWNGVNWTVIPSPNMGTASRLYGVATISSTNVWAVGYYDAGSYYLQPLTLHWNGSAWSIVPSPAPNGDFSQLFAVTAQAGNDVWAVGGYIDFTTTFVTLTLHWDGSAWSIVPSPSVGPYLSVLYGVAAVAANDVWAVGRADASAGAGALLEHWNGTAWSVVPGPNLGTVAHSLQGVLALAANNVWAVGSMQDGTSLVLRWNGSTWSQAASAAGSLNGIAASSLSYVWAVGTYQANTLIERWSCTAMIER